MVRRFLAYSLAHNRPVKVLLMEEMKYKNITVIDLSDDQVAYLTAGRKKPLVLPISQILSASYARGDDGDTLKYAAMEEKNESESE